MQGEEDRIEALKTALKRVSEERALVERFATRAEEAAAMARTESDNCIEAAGKANAKSALDYLAKTKDAASQCEDAAQQTDAATNRCEAASQGAGTGHSTAHVDACVAINERTKSVLAAAEASVSQAEDAFHTLMDLLAGEVSELRGQVEHLAVEAENCAQEAHALLAQSEADQELEALVAKTGTTAALARNTVQEMHTRQQGIDKGIEETAMADSREAVSTSGAAIKSLLDLMPELFEQADEETKVKLQVVVDQLESSRSLVQDGEAVLSEAKHFLGKDNPDLVLSEAISGAHVAGIGALRAGNTAQQVLDFLSSPHSGLIAASEEAGRAEAVADMARQKAENARITRVQQEKAFTAQTGSRMRVVLQVVQGQLQECKDLLARNGNKRKEVAASTSQLAPNATTVVAQPALIAEDLVDQAILDSQLPISRSRDLQAEVSGARSAGSSGTGAGSAGNSRLATRMAKFPVNSNQNQTSTVLEVPVDSLQSRNSIDSFDGVHPEHHVPARAPRDSERQLAQSGNDDSTRRMLFSARYPATSPNGSLVVPSYTQQQQQQQQDDKQRQGSNQSSPSDGFGNVQNSRKASGFDGGQELSADLEARRQSVLAMRRIELSLKCRNLFQVDWLTMLQPMIGVYVRDPTTGQFFLFDQTSPLRDDNNPDFPDKIILDFKSGAGMACMFRVFNAGDSGAVNDEDMIGSCVCELDDLVGNTLPHHPRLLQLNHHTEPLLDQELTKHRACVVLSYQPDPSYYRRGTTKCELAVHCSNLPVNLPEFQHSMPVVSLFSRDPVTQTLTYLGQTEKSKESASPSFSKTLLIDVPSSGSAQELKVSVYDTNVAKVTEKNRIGSAFVNLQELVSRGGMGLTYQLYNDLYADRLGKASVTVRCVRTFELDDPTVHIHRGKNQQREKAVAISETQVYDLRRPSPDVVAKVEEMLSFGRSFTRHFLERQPARVAVFYRSSSAAAPNGTAASSGISAVGSMSFPALCWAKEGYRHRHPSREMGLGSVTAVVLGKQAEAWQRASAESAPDACCCSIFGLTAGRANVLHLQAQYAHQRDAWIFALRTLVQCGVGGLTTPLRVLNAGEYVPTALPLSEAEEASTMEEEDASGPSSSSPQLAASVATEVEDPLGPQSTTTLELRVRCRGLSSRKAGGSLGPYVACVFEKPGPTQREKPPNSKWVYKDQTEQQRGSLEPVFNKTLRVTVPSTRLGTSRLRVDVYEMEENSPRIGRSDSLGYCIVNTAQITQQVGHELVVSLKLSSRGSVSGVSASSSVSPLGPGFSPGGPEVLLLAVRVVEHVDKAREALFEFKPQMERGSICTLYKLLDSGSRTEALLTDKVRLMYGRDTLVDPGFVRVVHLSENGEAGSWNQQAPVRGTKETTLPLRSVGQIHVGIGKDSPSFQHYIHAARAPALVSKQCLSLVLKPPVLSSSSESPGRTSPRLDLQTETPKQRDMWVYVLKAIMDIHNLPCEIVIH